MRRTKGLFGLFLLTALFPTGPSAQLVAPKPVPLPTLPVGSVVSAAAVGAGANLARGPWLQSPLNNGLILPASAIADSAQAHAQPVPSAVQAALPARFRAQAAAASVSPAAAARSERRAADTKPVRGFPEGPSAQTLSAEEGDLSSSELAEALEKSIADARHGEFSKSEAKGDERAGRRLDRMFDGSKARQDSDAIPVEPVAPQTGYLKAVEGLSGQDLFWALHDIEAKGHHAHDYKEASAFIFGTADNVTLRGMRGIVDAYSGVFVPGTGESGGRYGERGDENGDGYNDTGMNIEHVWPQSFFNKRLPMKSDVHHLMATFMHPNSVRGHMPFGEVQGGATYENKGGAKSDGSVFEPPDFTKGRVARALLYFFVRYCDGDIMAGDSSRFWGARLEMLLRWNREHPPTDFERRRNDLVERYQGNRNPFVDDPSLAERIGMDALRRPGRRASESVSRRAPESMPGGWAKALSPTIRPEDLRKGFQQVREDLPTPGDPEISPAARENLRADSGQHNRHGKRWNKRHRRR
ncbi:MAG: endonuclease [Elusimicrobiota bacterium]|jgi:hypothetical protein